MPLAISSTSSIAGPRTALPHPRDSNSSWVDSLRPPVGSWSSVGADTDSAGGRSKRKKMKGGGKEGSAEGPFCFSLVSTFSSVLSLFSHVAIATSCYQFTFVKKQKQMQCFNWAQRGEGGNQRENKSREWIFSLSFYLLVIMAQHCRTTCLTASSSP